MWKRFWLRPRDRDEWQEPASPSEDPELREIFVRSGLRVAAAFAVIFGLVYFALWWSGAAVGFGANRAAGESQPTWKVLGFVRSSATHQAVPWAVIEDDPNGRPPFFHTDATYSGSYELVTLAEPHQLRVSAPGYQTKLVQIGRAWFLWMPRGSQQQDIYLEPD